MLCEKVFGRLYKCRFLNLYVPLLSVKIHLSVRVLRRENYSLINDAFSNEWYKIFFLNILMHYFKV